MSDNDETLALAQIERELLLPAPPEEVWRIVTGPGWLAPAVGLDLAPGGAASFRSDEWSKSGWVEEAVAPGDAGGDVGRLVFWWGTDGESATRVELTLEPAGEEFTQLRVVESRPLEVLDVVGIPLPGGPGSNHGPAMLVAA